jgi:hypothetical protein
MVAEEMSELPPGLLSAPAQGDASLSDPPVAMRRTVTQYAPTFQDSHEAFQRYRAAQSGFGDVSTDDLLRYLFGFSEFGLMRSIRGMLGGKPPVMQESIFGKNET